MNPANQWIQDSWIQNSWIYDSSVGIAGLIQPVSSFIGGHHATSFDLIFSSVNRSLSRSSEIFWRALRAAPAQPPKVNSRALECCPEGSIAVNYAIVTELMDKFQRSPPLTRRLIYYSNYDLSNFGYFGRNPFGLAGKPYQLSELHHQLLAIWNKIWEL